MQRTSAHLTWLLARPYLAAGMIGACLVAGAIATHSMGVVPIAIAAAGVNMGCVAVLVAALAALAWWQPRVMHGGGALRHLRAIIASLRCAGNLAAVAAGILPSLPLTAARLRAARPMPPRPRLARLAAGINRPPRALAAR